VVFCVGAPCGAKTDEADVSMPGLGHRILRPRKLSVKGRRGP
jgi:hypothetical protein